MNRFAADKKRLALAVAMATGLAPGLAAASIEEGGEGEAVLNVLFSENFEGYSVFTATGQDVGAPYNPGVPSLTEGANEVWFGAHFEIPNLNTYYGTTEYARQSDIGVQSPVDYEPYESNTGRMINDAGLLFRLDTSGSTDIELEFDWHTFGTQPGDNFRVGYRIGDLPFGSCTGSGGPECYADLSGMSWSSDFTELLSGQFAELPGGGGTEASFKLPSASQLWVAFWMDSDEANGVCPDYRCGIAKIDNIVVTGEAIPVPAAAWLLGAGVLGFGFAARRRNDIA